MDDFNMNSLQESKNEWVSRLVTILTPHIIDGFRQIYTESYKLCLENDEEDKYLMTFQNFVARIPKWNESIIQSEVNRIIENSSCGYIEDLITCVHVIQLKALTCVRVGQAQKKIDINIPKLKDFIHKVYIQSARKIYTNIYLFEKNIPPLSIQKNNREIEILIKECILSAVRESIPVEQILRSYLEESVEEEVKEEIIEEIKQLDENKEKIKEEKTQESETKKVDSNTDETLIIKKNESDPISTEKADVFKLSSIETEEKEGKKETGGISFSDIDVAIDTNKIETNIEAPKNIEALENISEQRNEERKLQDLLDTHNEKLDEKITILEEPITINTDVLESLETNDLLGEVEMLQ